MNKQEEIILKNNMWQIMFKLSWPAIIAMVLYGLNTVFDAIFVGRFVGETALAGVSLAYPLTQISLGLGSLIGVGAGSALSIAIGAKDRETQKNLLGNVNYLTITIGLGLTILGILFASPLIKMMGGEGKALILGIDYLKITLYGSIFWIAGLAGNMIVRAEGKMGSAAIMMGIGLVINIIANYILIVLLGLGVKGAAWGTNIGMLVYTLCFFIYAKGSHITFKSPIFRVKRDKKLIKKIISLGMPALIMTIMSLIQGIVIFNALSNYGTTKDIAFYGVAYRIFTFALTPIFGLMRALQPAAGINYGAKQYKRVIQSFKVFGLAASILMIPFWVLILIKPSMILHLMLPQRVFLTGELNNFRLLLGLLPILPIIFMGMTFFPAINKSKPASIIGICRQLIFYVPLMLILPRFFGVSWVYKGSFIIDLICIIATFFLVNSEFKKLRKEEQRELREEEISQQRA